MTCVRNFIGVAASAATRTTSTFAVEYRKIPLRPVKNYDKHIKNSEAINGERLVLPQARSEGGPRTKNVSSVYSWST